MAEIIESVLEKTGGKERSVRWFRQKVKELGDVPSAQLVREGFVTGRPTLGTMNFFMYDPKYKNDVNVLPYYDRFPLVLPIQPVSGGFLGINFHYLPIPLRMKLFETLEKKDFKGDYRALKNVREIKPTIKHYLRGQLASKFLRLDEDEYAPSIFLPVQDFRKAGVSTVHSASRRMI